MNQTPPMQFPAERESGAAIVHNYASILTPKPPPGNGLLHVAVACALLPLAAGILCFVLWLITSWTGFPLGGLLIIAIGTILSVVGMSCLLAHYIATVSRAIPSGHRWRPTRRHWLTLLLLCINFPIAYGLTAAAFYIDEFYVVTITNGGPLPIDDLTVNFKSGGLGVKNIPANSSIKRRCRFTVIAVNYVLKESGVQSTGNVPVNLFRGDLQITVHDGRVDAAAAPGGNSRSHFQGDSGD